ncbi:MAG: hypothetical protein KF745_01735 [Phycisphaeraceae bacterium]|nr:hypothetical protein [Phycisphaeraceae bacterium]
MDPVIVFDDGKGLLSPLTDLRPAFHVRTGALSLLERLMVHSIASPGATHLRVTSPLLAALAAENGEPVNAPIDTTEPVLVINGRWIGTDIEAVAGLSPGAALLDHSGDLIAARIPPTQVDRVLAGDFTGLGATRANGLQLLTRPWHIRSARDALLRHDLALLLGRPAAAIDAPSPTRPNATAFGQHPVNVSSTAKIYPGVILDAEAGPVYIDDHAVIRPGVTLCGPVYVGPHSTILDRALIKANTAIGPHCKVAGEVGGTIFHGWANKAHDGHLGDSWVGQWANLGAGTTNSNLLNTYDQVICRALHRDGTPGQNERTGEQFLGAIIGDHAKFAICTRIMTGAIVGTGTMWAASAPVSGTIAPLSWVTDAGARAFRSDKFIEIARTVMARRSARPSEEYLALLRALPAPTR